MKTTWLLILLNCLCGAALAQDFPSRRISIVVTSPAGGSADGSARVFADKLRERLGQTVIVENRPGASGLVGLEYARSQPADGHTLIHMGTQMSTPKGLQKEYKFDPATEFTALGRFATSPFLIVTSLETPAKTLQDFVAHAKANPGKLNYGVITNTLMQLDMIRFGVVTQTKLTEIPYQGAAPINTALLGNQVQMSFMGSTAIPQVRAGKLVALAVASKSRWSLAPEVPTTYELGIEFESGFWYGFTVLAATPASIVQRLARDIAETGKSKEVQDGIRKLSMDPVEPSVAEMNEVLRRERVIYAQIAKSMGIEP